MSKCNYCAFFSVACASPDWEKYTNGIITEINHWATILGRISVPTIFFGGGTPSLMPTNCFAKIMQALNDNFDVLSGCEVTMESNPGTLDEKRLDEFVANGVNRLSIGVQSFDDDELLFLGRRHNAVVARNLIELAQNHSIRVSADFIYGIPGHTVQSVEKLCNQINEIGITHCSMYELTIEENTPFGKMKLSMPTNDEMADMYMAITNILKLPRYEVSNYATPGFECRHNQNVWNGGAYIGLGAGAAGRVFMNDTWYEQSGGINGQFIPISNKTRAIERVITGMRTMRGVLLAKDIQNVVNMEYVNKHPEMVVVENGCMYATKRGLITLDDLLVNLIK